MPDALEITGDIISAGSALAGLLLVFMGSIATSYESYEATEKRSALPKFQPRIWFAFNGFALSLFATVAALVAKWWQWECAAIASVLILFISFGFAATAALRAALDVK
jgi:hypothetical protein